MSSESLQCLGRIKKKSALSKENGTDLKRRIGITCKVSCNKLRVQVTVRHMDWHIQNFVLYRDKSIIALVTVTDIFQATVSWVVRFGSCEDGYLCFQEDPVACIGLAGGRELDAMKPRYNFSEYANSQCSRQKSS
jgi:hypothetical protein